MTREKIIALLENKVIRVSNEQERGMLNVILESHGFEPSCRLRTTEFLEFGSQTGVDIVSEKILEYHLIDETQDIIFTIDMLKNEISKFDKISPIGQVLRTLTNFNGVTFSVKERPLNLIYQTAGIPKSQWTILSTLLEGLGLMFREGQKAGMSYRFKFDDNTKYKDISNLTKIVEQNLEDLVIREKHNNTRVVKTKRTNKTTKQQNNRVFSVGQVSYCIINNLPRRATITDVSGIFNEDKMVGCDYKLRTDCGQTLSVQKIYPTKDELLEMFKVQLSTLK